MPTRRLRLLAQKATTLAGRGNNELAEHLFGELESIAAPTLWVELQLFRTQTDPMATLRPVSEDDLTAFAQRDLAETFARYPMLERLLDTAVAQFNAATREMIARFERDHPDRRIARLEPGLSDRHNGGRSSALVVCEDGHRLIYKPKDLRVDAAWSALTGGPAIDARDGYGWAEFVEPAACDNPHLFYRRVGEQLALAHMLKLCDVHAENMIACGNSPVIVDLEAMLADQPDLLASSDAVRALMQIHRDSVWWTNILPTPEGGADYSALASPEAQRAGNLEPQNNTPHIAGDPCDPADYVDEITLGFAERYRAGLPDLAPFEGATVRVLYRKTSVYLRLRRAMCAPDALVSEEAMHAPLSRLTVEPIASQEKAALRSGDIPYFTQQANLGRVQQLGEADLGHQVSLIRLSLGAPDRLRQSAMDRLVSSAIHLPGDRIGWIGLCGVTSERGPQLGPLGPELYDGNSGIALVLAAAGYRDLAMGAVRLIADQLPLVPRVSGGVPFALAHAARWLGGECMDVARAAAARLDPIGPDLIEGAAGAVIGALAVGDRKAAQRLDLPDIDAQGLAHGAAGVALARFLLNGDRTQLATPDGTKWCWGATGVGLARLAMGEHAERELAIVRAAAGGPDHLCCGRLGRAELLLCAGEGEAAGRIVDQVVADEAEHGHFRLWPQHSDKHHPGLYTGLAGIAYQLMRVADPTLPSLLSWSLPDLG